MGWPMIRARPDIYVCVLTLLTVKGKNNVLCPNFFLWSLKNQEIKVSQEHNPSRW